MLQASILPLGREVAIKLESVDAKHSQLAHEARVYESLAGDGVLLVHWFGIEHNYNVMIMDLLGPSLANLFKQSEHRFSSEARRCWIPVEICFSESTSIRVVANAASILILPMHFTINLSTSFSFLIVSHNPHTDHGHSHKSNLCLYHSSNSGILYIDKLPSTSAVERALLQMLFHSSFCLSQYLCLA